VVLRSPARIGSLDFPLDLVRLASRFEVLGCLGTDAIRRTERPRSANLVIWVARRSARVFIGRLISTPAVT
jgi:hypothetical protein